MQASPLRILWLVTQTWISLLGMTVEVIGLAAAGVGLRRSKPYGGGHTESHWGWIGLGIAALGLIVQIFDLAIRPALW